MKQRQISTNSKATRQMRAGRIARVMLVGMFVAGFAACQSLTGMATSRDRNEPLWKQPTDAEQNLSVEGQKQAVDGVKLQNSWNPNSGVASISFSPDGQTLASGSSDSSIKLWKRDGKLIKSLNKQIYTNVDGGKVTPNPVYSVSFSPDGQTLASGATDGTITLWKRDGTLITTLKGHNTGIASVSFSPDGQTLASSSSVTTSNDPRTIKLWDLNEVASQR